ncbi:MAG: hypothetical protein IPJ39_14305 [Saprospiraceae bacterium]|nr:hypothetical protein [Saprospiraceae bacterium]
MQQVLCLDKMKQLPIKFIICTIIFLVGVLPLRSQIQVDTVSVLTYYIAGKTATGIRTTKIREPFIAISRDLLKTYPFYIRTSHCLNVTGKAVIKSWILWVKNIDRRLTFT